MERANSLNRAVKKWYPILKTLMLLKQKDVAKQISDETTLNRKEAEMALDQLEKVLINNLLAGNSVQLGDWGSFRLTCKSTPADTKDGVSAANIKKLNVRFSAGKLLNDALAGASFIPAESVVTHS
jgi:predicted histone-like DNA-binding protein